MWHLRRFYRLCDFREIKVQFLIGRSAWSVERPVRDETDLGLVLLAPALGRFVATSSRPAIPSIALYYRVQNR